MSSEKKTSRHYTPAERQLFLTILKSYRDIIENKKSDGSTLKEKENAWKEVMEKYNSSLLITQTVS